MFRLLFSPIQARLYLREIERQSGLAVRSVQQELAYLKKLGLVTSSRDGNRVYYEANRDNPIYPEIRSLVVKTTGLVPLLKETLQKGGFEINCVFVFGSYATGNLKPESDIDLMIIGDVGLRALTKHLSKITNLIGREVNPQVVSPVEWRRGMKSKGHFIQSVAAGEKTFIVGDEDVLKRLAE
ncbi:MAG: nucleotidyltransferase domain-containing protein [Bdellovibrionaceae bacterium]|nr:nucleotidyltransferase domain-containing protein [Pseudobdellovibrionaceae bacterium]